jgi:uncharacterized membrane protein
MPYTWNDTDPTQSGQTKELHLWPHQSLPPKGYAGFLGTTYGLVLIPLLMLLGTAVLWWLLPFFLLALGALWLALDRSRRDAQVCEVLTLTQDHAHLSRRNPRGPVLEWDCNRYWARAEMHESGGPVPFYVTLTGSGRKVEIGAFLSEEERMALYGELVTALRR